MANVVRFTLPTARNQAVPGVGAFHAGVLDIDANDLRAVKRARYLTPPYGAIELGTVDSTTPKPALPAVPGPPAPDPYPQYVTDADLDNPASGPMVKLKAASVAAAGMTTDSTGGVTPGVYDRSRQAFNRTPKHFRKTRARLSAVQSGLGDLRLSCIGDSNTMGLGPIQEFGSPVRRAYPERVRDIFAAERGGLISGDGALYIGPADQNGDGRWVKDSNGTHGIVNGLLAAYSNGAGGVFTPTRPCTGFEVTYCSQFGGSFTVSIDGGAATTVTYGSGTQWTTWTSPLLASGQHTITIADVSGDQSTFYPLSIEALTPGQGLRVARAGVSGVRAQQFADTAFNNYLDCAKPFNPHCVAIMLGTNDAAAGRTVSQFSTDLGSIIDRVKAWSASPDVLLIAPPARGDVDISSYYPAYYAVATSKDVPLLDLRDRFGSAAAAAAAGLMRPDAVHLTSLACDDVARAVLAAILP